jgi:ACS family hexuronate transporter-like MFS transporter
VGAVVAPVIVLGLCARFGSWRPAFLVTGTLGLIWLVVWRWLYHPPETHPHVTSAERAMIVAAKQSELEVEAHAADQSGSQPTPWLRLVAMPQTWGIILGRALTDPVWYFISDWFAIYLVSKGYRLEDTLVGYWVPFLAADFGNFFGGGLSSWLIARGWKVLAARKFVIVVCGLGMALIALTAWVTNFTLLIALFGLSTFAYAAWSTMALSLSSDLYASKNVASVSGLSGTGSGVGTIVSTSLIGYVADHYSFGPVLIGASLIPLLATVLVLVLVRPVGRRATPSP